MANDFLNITCKEPSLVVASAGTGKTYTIIENVLKLLCSPLTEHTDDPLSISQILILSFTEKTVNEMRARLWKRLKQAVDCESNPQDTLYYKKAMLEFDTLPLYTIHSFCKSLNQHLMNASLDQGTISKTKQKLAYPFLLHCLNNKNLKDVDWNVIWSAWKSAHEFAQALETLIDKVPHKDPPLFHICHTSEISDMFLRIFEHYQALTDHEKHRQSILYFDDLLWQIYGALLSSGDIGVWVRSQYAFVFIDEAQDTDPLQWRIMEALFIKKGHPLAIIGDPKQSIYRFRGADLESFISLQSQVVKKHTLNTNYRSSKALTHALNHLFDDEKLQQRFSKFNFTKATSPKEPIATTLTQGNAPAVPVSFEYLDDLKPIDHLKLHWQNRILSNIISLLKDHQWQHSSGNNTPVTLRDIAILVRTNKEARSLQSFLKMHRIHAVTYKNNDLTKQHAFKEWFYVLQALHEPQNVSKISLATEIDFVKFLINTHQNLVAPGQPPLSEQDVFFNWHHRIQSTGLNALLHAWVDQYHVLSYFISTGKHIQTYLMHQQIIDFILKMSHHTSLASVVYTFKNHLADDNLSISEWISGLYPSIPILTIHNAKGLEFPIVILGGGIHSPRKKSDFQANLLHDTGKASIFLAKQKDQPSSYLAEEEAEEYRLLYVAMTRAQHKLMAPLLNENSKFKASTHIFNQYTDISSSDSFSKHGIEVIHQPSMPLSDTSIEALSHQTDAPELINIKHYKGLLSPPHLGHTLSFSSISKLSPIDITQKADDDILPVISPNLDVPRGAKFGSLFHLLMEKIDFREFHHLMKTNTLEAMHMANCIIEESLHTLSAPSEWKPYARSLLEDCLLSPFSIENQPVYFSQINVVRKEMEFLLSTSDVKNMCMSLGLNLNDFLSFKPDTLIFNGSYLKGIIDLVFEFRGKIYLADYKTNDLGDLDNYQSESLMYAITQHRYDLQMLIYSVCIQQMLQSFRHKGTFNDTYGGFYFYFVRGMSPSYPDRGVYHFKASEHLIQTFKTGWKT